MTNKEAIEELKKVDTLDMPARLCEAYYMSIKALEQEPCDEYGNYKYPSDVELTEPNTATSIPCEDVIRELPPVNPQEPKTGHWSRKTKVDAYDIAGVKTWGIKCQCDRCDFTTIVVEDFGYYKYCLNCGCRMVEP